MSRDTTEKPKAASSTGGSTPKATPAPASGPASKSAPASKGAPAKGAAPKGAAPKGAAASKPAPAKASTAVPPPPVPRPEKDEPVTPPTGTPAVKAPVSGSTEAPPTITPASGRAPRTGAPAAAGATAGATAGAGAASSPGPRRVRLAVSRVDPWSVMKLAFLLSIAIGIMIVVASVVFWLVLDGLHVFTEVNDTVVEIFGDTNQVDILQFVELKRVASLATIIAVVDVVLLTALSTIGAFLYNVVAALVGGIHLTLTDE
jgi:hypothetical protein